MMNQPKQLQLRRLCWPAFDLSSRPHRAAFAQAQPAAPGFPVFGLAHELERDDDAHGRLTAPRILGIHCAPVLQNTSYQAADRPDSAVSAFLRPNSARFLGGMGLSVRTSARLGTGFEHPAHPLRFKTPGVASEAHQGAKAMTESVCTSLRTSAQSTAPTEGTTSSPSFAFKRHAPLYGNLHEASAIVPDAEGDLISVAATGRKVSLSRTAGGLHSSMSLTPEQARAVGAELIEAAEAVQPREEAPHETPAAVEASPIPAQRLQDAAVLVLDLAERKPHPLNREIHDALDRAFDAIEADNASATLHELRSALELLQQPVQPATGSKGSKGAAQEAGVLRERMTIFVRAALLLIEVAPATSATRGA